MYQICNKYQFGAKSPTLRLSKSSNIENLQALNGMKVTERKWLTYLAFSNSGAKGTFSAFFWSDFWTCLRSLLLPRASSLTAEFAEGSFGASASISLSASWCTESAFAAGAFGGTISTDCLTSTSKLPFAEGTFSGADTRPSFWNPSLTD